MCIRDSADRHQIAVDPKQVEPRTLKKGIFTKEVESPEMVADRLSQEITKAHRATIEKASVSSQERRKAKALQNVAREQQKRLQSLERTFEEGLLPNQVTKLALEAMKMRKENERQKQERREQERERREQKRARRRSQGMSL